VPCSAPPADDLTTRSPSVRADAVRWFQNPDAGRLVSLAMVCDVLGLLNTHRVSRRALRWAGLAGKPPGCHPEARHSERENVPSW
jgi:hypothetical protein